MLLRSMFSGIAEKYDLVNKIMTFRLDRVWRQKCAQEFDCGHVLLDLYCGSGELSLELLKKSNKETVLVGLDFNREMLKGALKKSQEACVSRSEKTTPEVSFVVADVANLPLKNESVDTIGTSFGFRNLIYRNARAETNLSELLRILQSNGRFICLETGQPNNKLERTLLHAYFTYVVPVIGWLITGQKNAYDYLGSSATNFKSGQEVSSMLVKAGFHQSTYRHVTFGAVALIVASK